jgi:hypothetical protein
VGCATAEPCPVVAEHDCYWCSKHLEWECGADREGVHELY